MSWKVARDLWFRRLFEDNPWSYAYAVGRSVVAFSPLLTLLFNPPENLFPLTGDGATPTCTGLMEKVGLFCVVPSPSIARFIGIAVLTAVVAGWAPRLTALPHVWVAVSLHNSMVGVEGGDQIAGNLALLLLPVALLDRRWWHWPIREQSESLAEPSDLRRRRLALRFAEPDNRNTGRRDGAHLGDAGSRTRARIRPSRRFFPAQKGPLLRGSRLPRGNRLRDGPGLFRHRDGRRADVVPVASYGPHPAAGPATPAAPAPA